MLNGYKRLEYVEFVDNAYIDTGYIPTDNTAFKFEAAFSEYSTVQYGALSAAQFGHARYHGGAGWSDNQIEVYLGTGDSRILKENDGNFHLYYISENLCMLDELESSANLTLPGISLYIGSRNTYSPPNNFQYSFNRCRYAKIYENGELVRHYIPVLSNGRYCMYDLIQGNYYYNAAGVGYLTGG